MTANECKEYAEKNPEFEEYCVKFCQSHRIIKDDGIYALKMIQNVAEFYKESESKE